MDGKQPTLFSWFRNNKTQSVDPFEETCVIHPIYPSPESRKRHKGFRQFSTRKLFQLHPWLYPTNITPVILLPYFFVDNLVKSCFVHTILLDKRLIYCYQGVPKKLCYKWIYKDRKNDKTFLIESFIQTKSCNLKKLAKSNMLMWRKPTWSYIWLPSTVKL